MPTPTRNASRKTKQTAIGELTVEWEVQTVGQIAAFSNGHGFTPRDWKTSGLPIIRIQNLNGSRNFNHFTSEPESDWIVLPGDLLFAWAGVKGVSFGPTIWPGPKGVLNQHIYKIHPSPQVDKSWLYLALRDVTQRIEGKAHGFKSSLVHVQKSEIAGAKLLVPPLSEQRRIAAVLGVWDRALTGLEKLRAAKQQRKQGLMQQLLTGKRRFPEFKGQKWQTVHLGDVFAERSEINRTDLSLVAITSDRGVIPRDQLDRNDTSSEDKSKYLRIAPGDIGYNTMRMWQGVSGVSEVEGIVSPAYTICIPQEGIDRYFAGYLFKFRPVIHLFHSHSQGLVKDTLNLKFPNFARIKVTLPPVEEQKRIAGVFRTVDREIALLERKAAALSDQRKGLMQQLLTGKVRVRGTT